MSALSYVCMSLVLVCICACASTPDRPRADPRLGQVMDLSAPRLDGEGVLELSELRGKVVLVDVWASWCVPCRDALVAWEGVRSRLGDGFEVVAISVDEERDDALAFLAELTPSFPTAWDARRALVTAFPVEIMPTAFLLDRDGVVRYIHPGFLASTSADIERQARLLLQAGQSVRSP